MSDKQTSDWNTRYAREDYLFGEAPNAFLAAQAPRLKAGGTALAVADGEGRNGVWLAQQGLDVLSLDSSAVAQDKARRLAQARGAPLRLELGDLAAWEFPPARFDVVAAIFIQFAGPALRARLFEGMKRTLKPGGLLLLEGYRPEQIAYGTGGPRVVENLYTEAMLREAFADLEIVELKAYDAEIEEGAGHKGMSALIDLVARKPA
ncbi:cyclopropane-fatty-acyl-phospholipid synthase family protein [Phenylobacterium sp.]|uniref:SAM-dependent methyltransferase n=1 Tax=Phenylobacterium sp. TaxID=1871053 RepID=UPI0035B42CBD